MDRRDLLILQRRSVRHADLNAVRCFQRRKIRVWLGLGEVELGETVEGGQGAAEPVGAVDHGPAYRGGQLAGQSGGPN